jgi:hypothetical protein
MEGTGFEGRDSIGVLSHPYVTRFFPGSLYRKRSVRETLSNFAEKIGNRPAIKKE